MNLFAPDYVDHVTKLQKYETYKKPKNLFKTQLKSRGIRSVAYLRRSIQGDAPFGVTRNVFAFTV